MSGKHMEGSPEQKRAKQRKARAKGKLPSEVDATTGAAQQRRHLGNKVDHHEKLAARHRGQDPTSDYIRHKTRGRSEDRLST